MKILHFIAAALLFVGIGVSTEASAQRYDGYSQSYRGNGYDRPVRYESRYDRRDDRRWDRRDRRWDRRDYRRDQRRWSRHNDRRVYGWRGNRGCNVVYRHGRRFTVCR